MATRYVWRRYQANNDPMANESTTSAEPFSNAYYWIGRSKPAAAMLTSGPFADKPFYRTSGGSTFTQGGISEKHVVTQYGQYLVDPSYDHPLLCVCPDQYYTEDYSWQVGSHVWIVKNGTGVQVTFQTYTPEVSRGEYLYSVSSDKSDAYPNGYDESGYWYVYQGSDNIDPTAIRLDVSKIVPGKQVTATITAPTSKLDGTISYYLSYSINGGGYQDLASTTSKSYTFTVPAGAQSLRLKVYAADNQGFASDVDVYSVTYYANSAPTDPASVSIPAEVSPGKDFTVGWSAATDPDGDLSGYEVQMAYDGGSSWVGVTSTSATSASAAVAEGHTSVRFRVRAYDSSGATSGWAYSNTAAIRSLRAYVGISDRARRVNKIYIGVNGTARRVVKAYVGVNGVARKIM